MSAQTELKDLMALYNSRFPDSEKASIIEEATNKGFILTFKLSEKEKFTVDLKHQNGIHHMTDKKLYGFKQTGYTSLLGILAAQFVLNGGKSGIRTCNRDEYTITVDEPK